MSATHSRFGRSAVKFALDQIRCLTVAALDRRVDESASAYTDKTCHRHQPGDALATDANAFGCKIDMNARRPVSAARSRVCGADLCDQRGIFLGTP